MNDLLPPPPQPPTTPPPPSGPAFRPSAPINRESSLIVLGAKYGALGAVLVVLALSMVAAVFVVVSEYQRGGVDGTTVQGWLLLPLVGLAPALIVGPVAAVVGAVIGAVLGPVVATNGRAHLAAPLASVAAVVAIGALAGISVVEIENRFIMALVAVGIFGVTALAGWHTGKRFTRAVAAAGF